MAGIYYAIVDGDPFTSGPNSRVCAAGASCSIDDESGRQRNMAFIGDNAYCEKCNSTGIIIGGAGVDNNQRLIDLEDGGRRQAVGGDYVRCKCPEHPRVVARHGRSWFMVSPHTQDLIAVEGIRFRRAIDSVVAGDIKPAIDKLKPDEWVSFQVHDFATLKDWFVAAGGTPK